MQEGSGGFWNEEKGLRRSKCLLLAVYFINPIFPGTGQEGVVEEAQDQRRFIYF